MRELAKQYLKKAQLDGFAKNMFQTALHAGRTLGGVDSGIVKRYCAANPVRKLHIGCGENVLPDWLNSDFYPSSPQVLHLDATTRYPFDDESFDRIFSEHMIEHIPFAGGTAMLAECHRVLKRGGRIRISTPNLRFLVDLYSEQKSQLQRDYIKWSTETFIENAPCNDDTFVINLFVRHWGHLFIYDEKTLRASLTHAGFSDIRVCSLNQSEDGLMRNLENEGRMPPGFLKLESMTLEATK